MRFAKLQAEGLNLFEPMRTALHTVERQGEAILSRWKRKYDIAGIEALNGSFRLPKGAPGDIETMYVHQHDLPVRSSDSEYLKSAWNDKEL